MSDYKDDLRKAYDADVERRAAMTPSSWRTNIVDSYIADLTAQGATSVLELGCGTGQLARYVSDAGFEVTAIDLSPANVKATHARGVEALEADFADLPFAENSFGVVKKYITRFRECHSTSITNEQLLSNLIFQSLN